MAPHFLKKRWIKVLLLLTLLVMAGAGWLNWYIATMESRETSLVAFQKYCAGCHGADLIGTELGANLLADNLQFGDSPDELVASIQNSSLNHSVAEWQQALPEPMFTAIAYYIVEQREEFPTTRQSYITGLDSPEKNKTVATQYYTLSVEHWSSLAERPYSIAPLPDGSVLVNEKVGGLSIIEPTGRQSQLIANTPEVWDTIIEVKGTYVTLGSMLEVALHPNYAENGWVYLSHAHHCFQDCGFLVPKTMVRVVRGRIKGQQWVDEEVIWSVHPDYYTVVPDGVAGGRLAFDDQGYLYISVGGKAPYKHLHDMNTPYGKVHRVWDDGRIPEDNPFWQPDNVRGETSTRNTVWSFGHRTIQGLGSHPRTHTIWGAEMGPRGGDEINLIEKAGNFGWPLYTGGLDYDGTPVTIGEDLGLTYPIEDTVLPVVDFSPAPALSNLAFSDGEIFSRWGNDMLVGSLKAQTLYRLRIDQGKLVEQEKLITELGRIRDIEMGYDGLIYIAIEHGDNGSIIRLTPQD